MHAYDDEVTAAARAAREAERAAPETGGPGAAPAPDAAAVLHLQRTAGNAGVAQLMASEEDPHGLSRLVGTGGGSPLPAPTRVQMERAIGADFSSVRVHTGADADASARSLGAHAYTAGEDIVFASGRYDPDSSAGQRTLAHELTHVVQQRSGPVDGTDDGTGVRVSDPSDRFEREAEASADRVMAGGLAGGVDDDAGAAAAAGPAVQREAAADEDLADEPLADEPVADEPVADEPVAEAPADDGGEAAMEEGDDTEDGAG